MRGDLKVGWLCGLDGGEIPKRGPLWGGALWVEGGGGFGWTEQFYGCWRVLGGILRWGPLEKVP